MLRIIQLLSDGEFHSGEELGNHLNLTRSAVWKHVKQLNLWDIEVESRPGKGYRIPNGLNLLNPEQIRSQLKNEYQSQISTIEVFQSLASTNDYFLSGQFEAHKNRVCLAEKQTAGKGRYKRPWFSPFAKNIALSLLWHFPKDMSELSGLSLATATAVIKVLKRYGIEGLTLKWPNDILWNGQKLSGVLIEIQGETHNVCRLIIGIGININIPNNYQGKINQPWTDLQTILNKRPERNTLTALLLNELMDTLLLFQEQGLRPFLPDWQAYDRSYSTAVTLTTPTQIIEGLSHGINEKGHLLLKTKSGDIMSFSTGEISF